MAPEYPEFDRLPLRSREISARAAASGRLRAVRWQQGVLFAILIAIGLAGSGGYFDSFELTYPASVLLITVIVWNFYSWHLLGRKWFEPYSLFLLAACLFNGGQALLEPFGLNPGGMLSNRVSPDLCAEALYLVALGLTALHFGALAALLPTDNRQVSRTSIPASPSRLRALRIVGLICMGAAVIPMTLLLRDTMTTALNQGYMGLYGRASEEGIHGPIQAVASFMISGAMFLAAGSRKKRLSLVIAVTFVLAYAAVMFISGSRSPAAMLLISFAWVYERSVRRLPRIAIIAGGLCLLLILPVVGALRDTPGLWQDPVRLFKEEFQAQDNPFTAVVSEMGGSLATVAYTIGLIPSVRPFDYGASYFYAASTVIPNVGWAIHPAIAHGFLADWLIKTVDPTLAARGGGLGYSFIAEAFANFGWYGSVLLLVSLGYLLMRLFRWGTDTNDCARHAVIGTFLAFFLLFARGESNAVVRSLAWYSLLPYLAVSAIARASTVRGKLCGQSPDTDRRIACR